MSSLSGAVGECRLCQIHLIYGYMVMLHPVLTPVLQALLGNPTLLQHLKSTGEISQQQIMQLQQLLPGAQQPQPPQGVQVLPDLLTS